MCLFSNTHLAIFKPVVVLFNWLYALKNWNGREKLLPRRRRLLRSQSHTLL